MMIMRHSQLTAKKKKKKKERKILKGQYSLATPRDWTLLQATRDQTRVSVGF